ncbi:SOS response-associated peptidase family protein [Ochrovirga pacifica]|uniref:SOS response-associated peptidase family protein n=1 Tax=Ochrovirga pacifica TaxID=1042376 RepID=UPI0002558E83|nr:SOS response-associated peptidase family protein [Ochrovirga pacifica]
MKYKLSNTATVQELAEFAQIPLKYPRLYQKQFVISGKEETIIPIITQEDTNQISFGIWGLLPNNYDEDWQDFQNVIDTLTIKHNELDANYFVKNDANLKRCLILITGFFTTYLDQGKTQTFFISQKDNQPFYVAGCYNQLNDGFLTFALLLKDQDKVFQKVQNLSDYMPFVIDNKLKDLWLSEDEDLKSIIQKTNKASTTEFKITQIDKSVSLRSIPSIRKYINH